MRYIKVLLLVVLFFLIMMFFVQNQGAFSQTMPLKLDLLFIAPLESAPLPFYTLLVICFVLGGGGSSSVRRFIISSFRFSAVCSISVRC